MRVTSDVAIAGAGLVGLSGGWRLAREGRCVHLLNPSEPGSEASWAAGRGLIAKPGSVATRGASR